jgi:hypothetical protein
MKVDREKAEAEFVAARVAFHRATSMRERDEAACEAARVARRAFAGGAGIVFDEIGLNERARREAAK